MLSKISKRNYGFTLVELIVVLVILAILATLLVPALTTYIEKSKEKKIIAETREIYTAVQAVISEQYGLNADLSTTNHFAYLLEDGLYSADTFGRCSNNSLYKVQNANGLNQMTNTDIAIAEQLLIYIESQRGNTSKRYTFRSSHNPCGITVKDYENTNKQPGILTVYNIFTGKVEFVEFGRDGLLCRLTKDGEIEVIKNGTFTKMSDRL